VQETSQGTGKKPKRFLCHRCQRNFARLEHLQRHERIREFS
jgi:transposase-like protein